MGFFGMFGGKSNENIRQMLKEGAIVVDVRTPGEFQGGHVAGSKNYPLQSIEHKAEELKKFGRPLVLCCASGGRSGQAAHILRSRGIECENGGGWMQVNALLE